MSDRGDLLREVDAGDRHLPVRAVPDQWRPPAEHQRAPLRQDRPSDDYLDRLFSCMGRRLYSRPTRQSLGEWRPTIERNLLRHCEGVTGQPHRRNLEAWSSLVERADVVGLQRVLTGLDRGSIEMREMARWAGLLSQDDRSDVLTRAS